MISSAIASALAGLQIASRRTEIAARNISGSTVEGYVRKEGRFSSGPLGLQYDGIIRAADLPLAREAGQERAGLAGMEAELTARTSLVQRLGDPRTGNDLGSSLTRLSQALTQLGNRPDDIVLQQEAVDSAGETARFLNSLSKEVQNERLFAQRSIAADVATANDRLAAIQKLNEEIRVVPPQGDASDLLDARDKAVQELTTILPVRVSQRPDGTVTLLTETGVTLLDEKVHELQFAGGDAMGPELAYDRGRGGLPGLTVDGIDLTPGSGAPQAIRTGRLAGSFAVRDQVMPQAQRQLDALASTLARAFQQADATIGASTPQAGLLVDSAAPDAGMGAGTVTGLAGRLTVNPRVDPARGGEVWRVRTGVNATSPGEVGDGDQARRFARIFEQSYDFDPAAGLASNTSLIAYANQITDAQQAGKSALEANKSYQSSLVTSLEARLADNQGVDLDKELQDTLLFERSYAASAQVLQTATRMLDELLQRI
ncbi:flagellar hook-associated protein FlgK [Benzoatithermus flavus]|uniref:Flagellar hook-associated protein 1 n=1 Tax=Benzoatithermus flavus TaxID=3108223 RepID=A0ABU8XUU0_9PROT